MPEPSPGEKINVLASQSRFCAARARNARAGGLAAHSPVSIELQEFKDEIRAVIRDVKDGKTPPNVACVLAQLANVLLRGIEQERKVRELDEIDERLRQIEERTETRRVA